jgi:hypothetical protein
MSGSGAGARIAARPRETTARRFSSGRECWVYPVPAPEDLPGYHPELIRSALDPREPLGCLVYAPLYAASGGPFGISGASGSHAIAVTPDRILVSRDPHRDGAPRSVLRIPLDSVRRIEIGEALVLSWLVLCFSVGGQLRSETVFFQSSGKRHFEAVIRALRSRAGLAPAGSGPKDPGWLAAESGSPPYLRGELAGLVLDGERPLVVLRSTERWGADRTGHQRFRRCLSPSALVVLSDRAILFVESEQPSRPGGLVFGVNTTVVERLVVRGCRIERRGGDDDRQERVVVDIGADGCTKLALPFDEEFQAAARSAVEILCAGPEASA